MVRPTSACRVGVALAALAAAQGEETQGSAGHVAFCIETPNGPNTRVRIPMSAGGPQSCTTMYCLHEGDTADSGNCRCQRDDGQRCLDLSYAPPEPEPEPEDSLASTEQRCAQLPEGSAEWFAENCDTMEQPGLVWLLLLLGIYLLIAMATARMYRRYRAKNEALWEEAKANGTVKIEIDEEEMRAQELDEETLEDMMLSIANGKKDKKERKKDGMVGSAVNDLVGDIGNTLGAVGGEKLGAVSGAVGGAVGDVVGGVEHLAVDTGKQIGKMGEEMGKTIGAKLFGDFLSISKKELAQTLGPDASTYLAHLKQCGVFFFRHTLTTMPLLIFCYQHGAYVATNGVQGWNWRIHSFTIGAFSYMCPEGKRHWGNRQAEDCDPANTYTWLAAVVTFLFCLDSIYFAYSRWKKLEKLKFALKVGTHSKSTVMIKRLPKQVLTHSGALERYFDQACPGQVEGVRVALGVHDLIVNVRQQKAIYRKLNNLRVSNPWLTDANNYGANKEEAEIRARHGYLLVELHQLEARNEALRNHEPEGAGCAFVTFRNDAYAQKFHLEAKMHGGRVAGDARVSGDTLVALNRSQWKIQMAPVQHDIYWENLGIPKSERSLRKVAAHSILSGLLVAFAMATFCMMMIVGVQILGVWNIDVIEDTHDFLGSVVSWVENLAESFDWAFYLVFATPSLLAFFALAEATSSLIKWTSKLEQEKTRTKKQSAYLSKCYLYFMVLHIITGTCGIALLALIARVHDDRMTVFLTLCALYHCNKFLLEILIYLPFRVLDGVALFYRPTREVASDEMGEAAEEEDADFIASVKHDVFHDANFDFSRQYGESLALFAMAHVYAVACPLMIFLCAIYFVVKYAVEKYILARHYSRPRISYGRRARMVTKYTMSSVVLGQWCTVILLWLVGRFSEAKLVMVSASLATLASLVYVNRKFKICGREVNLVALVIKHTRMNQIMGMTSVTQKVMGAVNTFSEEGGKKKKKKPAAAEAEESGECAVIYSVPSLESLRKDIEDERLWQPGMELVENPLSSGAHAAGSEASMRMSSAGAVLLQSRKLARNAASSGAHGGVGTGTGSAPRPGSILQQAGARSPGDSGSPDAQPGLPLIARTRSVHFEPDTVVSPHGRLSPIELPPGVVSPHGRVSPPARAKDKLQGHGGAAPAAGAQRPSAIKLQTSARSRASFGDDDGEGSEGSREGGVQRSSSAMRRSTLRTSALRLSPAVSRTGSRAAGPCAGSEFLVARTASRPEVLRSDVLRADRSQVEEDV